MGNTSAQYKWETQVNNRSAQHTLTTILGKREEDSRKNDDDDEEKNSDYGGRQGDKNSDYGPSARASLRSATNLQSNHQKGGFEKIY